MSKKSLTFHFDFSTSPIYDNEASLRKLERSIDRGSIEQVEKMFNVMFASGIVDDKPFYLTLDETNEDLLNKFDGKVDVTVPPRDNETMLPFKKNKLTFRIDYFFDKKENQTGYKTYINSNFRNSHKD
jgi:hypothetical protein